ncbi:MAG: septal ring lytic transglycosylase RlpA family protein [Alphaproteobacteria bacterium]|nr:septal ring lytic transglycosylase RlpA family protein [Alphaproteobacteria bacterium]MBP9878028.1 septal ring lytic transglycosylase RlpA family protein [Alphaproteobacteria bacterium]
MTQTIQFKLSDKIKARSARRLKLLTACSIILVLGACAEVDLASHVVKSSMPKQQEGMYKVGNPYKIESRTYTPKEDFSYQEEGVASWYGPGFHGKRTANGEVFDQHDITAAHRTLQLPCIARVTNLDNGRQIEVRINDRGPFKKDRIIDLSKKSAQLLGVHLNGTARVRVEVVKDKSMQIAESAKKGIIENPIQYAEAEQVKPAEAIQTKSQPIQTASADPVARQVASTSQTTTSSVSAAAPSGIYIHAGSFQQMDNAQKVTQLYKDFGKVNIETVTVNQKNFHRVLIGPFENQDRAQMVLSSIESAGGEAKLVSLE